MPSDLVFHVALQGFEHDAVSLRKLNPCVQRLYLFSKRAKRAVRALALGHGNRPHNECIDHAWLKRWQIGWS